MDVFFLHLNPDEYRIAKPYQITKFFIISRGKCIKKGGNWLQNNCKPHNIKCIDSSWEDSTFSWNHVTLSMIWNQLYNLKNVKNTHSEVIVLLSCRLKLATLVIVSLLHGCFSSFLDCANGTKSRKASNVILLIDTTIWRIHASNRKRLRSFSWLVSWRYDYWGTALHNWVFWWRNTSTMFTFERYKWYPVLSTVLILIFSVQKKWWRRHGC